MTNPGERDRAISAAAIALLTETNVQWTGNEGETLGRILGQLYDRAQNPPKPPFYELTDADVGLRFIRAWDQTWPLSDVLGYVQRGDVGKRLFRVRTNAGDRYILQVENNEQRDARVAREINAVMHGH